MGNGNRDKINFRTDNILSFADVHILGIDCSNPDIPLYLESFFKDSVVNECRINPHASTIRLIGPFVDGLIQLIVFNTNNRNWITTDYCNTDFYSHSNPKNFPVLRVALHEIGHVIGLPDPFPQDQNFCGNPPNHTPCNQTCGYDEMVIMKYDFVQDGAMPFTKLSLLIKIWRGNIMVCDGLLT